MEKILFDKEYFNIKDTLTCGQVFRFYQHLNGYKVCSMDKCCFVYESGNNTIIECENEDKNYFENYFDLFLDYSKIYEKALSFNNDMLTKSAKIGKGIRILNQNKIETLFSFMISQNNNIPRIKSIIEKLCVLFGEEKTFMGEKYHTFFDVKKVADATLEELKGVGLGYRAPYLKKLALSLVNGYDVEGKSSLAELELKKELLKIYGVGEKVADCVLLFGFKKTASFPVDTWMEKVYKQDFGGKLLDRTKISKWFVEKFGNLSGYFQQYMFHYKRNIEKDR